MEMLIYLFAAGAVWAIACHAGESERERSLQKERGNKNG